MKTPTYLDRKEQVIILKDKEIINRTPYLLENNLLKLSGSGTLFLYVEDYQMQNLNILLDDASLFKLYMIFKSSLPTTYHFNIEINDTSRMDVFSVIRNIEKTSVQINREFLLGKSSVLNLSNALLNMGNTTIAETVLLQKPYAEVNLDQLNIGAYNDVYHVRQDIVHQAPHTISNINNSLISNANAKLSYQVSGKIDKGNEFSSCKQSNKGIILSESGEIEVLPILYIDEYNVEASHGAAIGQIDEEQLYYLLSRGLTETEARSLIISGYTKPFVGAIEDDDIRDLVERQIVKRINEADIL
ncbi:MAG TPA: SufD family Fe-S cluster assembly protein [Bacillota bacterium]|nr:SufD family Fe-S cluster assembly protein [Bacillota bacterium]